MTLEDETRIMQITSDFDPNEEKESSIANQLLGMIDSVVTVKASQKVLRVIQTAIDNNTYVVFEF